MMQILLRCILQSNVISYLREIIRNKTKIAETRAYKLISVVLFISAVYFK